MNGVSEVEVSSAKSLSLSLKPRQNGQPSRTKRVAELEALADRLRGQLLETEAELQREKNRAPELGEFVRCPLTNFFGQVTKVTSRPHGRAWVEIIPYLGHNLPGHALMDLYDSWEIIDPPVEDAEAPAPMEAPRKLPSVGAFTLLDKPLSNVLPATKPAVEIERLIGTLWSDRGGVNAG
jgi:hypothetical protein